MSSIDKIRDLVREVLREDYRFQYEKDTGKTVVVFSCAHTDPSVSNERFTWLGEFLYDLKPDYVVDLGDGADMRSLNTYDTRYPQASRTERGETQLLQANDPGGVREKDHYGESHKAARGSQRENEKRVP